MDNSIGDRLREERVRLGYSQEELGRIGGVTGRAQRNYEGEREPGGKYLAAVSEVGVDVLYVVTGKRAIPVESSLSSRQKALLDHHANANEDGQRAIERLAMLEAQQVEKGQKKTRKAA